jgi:hypothetical protein
MIVRHFDKFAQVANIQQKKLDKYLFVSRVHPAWTPNRAPLRHSELHRAS